MKPVEIKSGIQVMPVIVDGWDTGRTVNFNPADQEFAEELYMLVHRIGQIHKEKTEQRKAEKDILKRFELNREEDTQMRQAVDDVFGDGFSNDVFKTRLFAVADGLTVVETFLFAILDEMDEKTTAAIASRDAKVKKYTQKYRKYS